MKALAIYKWDISWQAIKAINDEGLVTINCSYSGDTLCNVWIYHNKGEGAYAHKNRWGRDYLGARPGKFLVVFDDGTWKFINSEDEFYTGGYI